MEASAGTFGILERNTGHEANIIARRLAVSDKAEEISFYEFPVLYSEYNAMNIDQYGDQPWFEANRPEAIRVKAIQLDLLLKEEQLIPDFIKIDVEGAEDKVIAGSIDTLKTAHPVVILEYILDPGHDAHKKACDVLRSAGYLPYSINKQGTLNTLGDIGVYLNLNNIESDNIVFIKR